MSKDNYLFLKKHFSSYEIVYSESGDFAEIINPFSKDNIIVDFIPEDEFTPYLCRFSFQHRHQQDEKSVIEYITGILNQNIYAIEFFKDGKNRFGGDITAEELDNLFYEFLEHKTGYYGSIQLKNIVDSFKVRGWNPCYDFDAEFVKDEKGNITIVKTKVI